MNKEVKELFKQVREILDKYPSRQTEILFYIFGEDTIKEILNKPTYEELQAKVNQLETNIAEAIKLLLDNTADYTDGDFESMRFQNDIVKILERGKENE